jgi:hypothetical protein
LSIEHVVVSDGVPPLELIFLAEGVTDFLAEGVADFLAEGVADFLAGDDMVYIISIL